MLTDGAVTGSVTLASGMLQISLLLLLSLLISSGIEFQKFTIRNPRTFALTNGILASAILDYVHVFVFHYQMVPTEAM